MEQMTKPETEEVTEKMNIVKTSLSKIEGLEWNVPFLWNNLSIPQSGQKSNSFEC